MSWVGMNSDCLVSLSTITRIAVNPSDVGKVGNMQLLPLLAVIAGA